MVYLFSDLRISCYRNQEEIERIKHFLSFETTRAIDMPSLQNSVGIGCPTKLQNRKHIGGYRNVQTTSLSKVNQEHEGKLKHRKKKHWKTRV